jgi:hypothetical protein
MGLVAKIISIVDSVKNDANITTVKVDKSSNDNITCDNFAPIGDDSKPLANDYAAIMEIKRTGGGIAVGFVDPVNTKKSNNGDKRIYSRNTNDGQFIAEVWLKNDGEVFISNTSGKSIKLNPNGDVDIDALNINLTATDLIINSENTTINATTKLTINSLETDYTDGSGTIKHDGVSIDKNHYHWSTAGTPTPITSEPKN